MNRPRRRTSEGDHAPWYRYLRFWGPDVRADVRDEIDFHISGTVEELRARGMSEADARQLAENLGASFEVLPIEPLRAAFLEKLGKHFHGDEGRVLAEENLQSRIRGTALMALSNQSGEILLNTWSADRKSFSGRDSIIICSSA